MLYPALYTVYLQCPPDFVNEELPAVFASVIDALPFDFRSDVADDLISLVVSDEVGDLSRGQQIVD